MVQGLPRTSFNSSRLVRVLGDLAVTDVAGSKQSLADRLGQWLDVTDAITLFSALNGSAGSAAHAPGRVPAKADGALHEEFARLRRALMDSIGTDGARRPGQAHISMPTPALSAAADGEADFSPYHRYYLARQRDMQAGIGPLRAKARAALAAHSPDLKRLADLDAVFDQALAGRERNLLATVPLLLAKRFAYLHREAQAGTPAEDAPEQWMQPGGWLTTFGREMQAVLLAELDLRLEPVAGLIEALGNEVTKKQ